MEVGDLVALWINKKKVGVIVSVHSWESINDFIEVQWTDGTRYRHRAKDLEVL
tara:strand:+ start:8180 stop:8338 length:159 start_codon:yes stop_codon:yes gene_type:complete